jgi:hypothetical protein
MRSKIAGGTGKVMNNRRTGRLCLLKEGLCRYKKKKGPGKNPARLKVTTKSKPAYEKTFDQVVK